MRSLLFAFAAFAAIIPIQALATAKPNEIYDFTEHSRFCYGQGQSCAALKSITTEFRKAVGKIDPTTTTGVTNIAVKRAVIALANALDSAEAFETADTGHFDALEADYTLPYTPSITDDAPNTEIPITKRSPVLSAHQIGQRIGAGFQNFYQTLMQWGRKDATCWQRGAACKFDKLKRDDAAGQAADITTSANNTTFSGQGYNITDADVDAFGAAVDACWDRTGPCEAIQMLAGELIGMVLLDGGSEAAQKCNEEGNACSKAKRALDHLKFVAARAVDSLA